MSQKDSLPDTRPKTIQAFRVLHGLGCTESNLQFPCFTLRNGFELEVQGFSRLEMLTT